MAKSNNVTPVEFIETTSTKLENVQTTHPGAFIHVNDSNGDDVLYIGEDKVTDKFNVGDEDLNSPTRKVGGLNASTIGELKEKSVSELLLDILRPDPTVTSIVINQESVYLEVTETVTLEATVNPDNAIDKTVTWTSSNTMVASVLNGIVTANGVGSTNIIAKAGNKTAICNITVIPTSVESIILNNNTLSLSVGDSYKLTATVSPSYATNNTVTWTSSDPAVTVIDGVLKVVSVSTNNIIITAQAEDKSAICMLTIIPTIPIVLSYPSVNISYSGTKTIDAGDILPVKENISLVVSTGLWSDGTSYAGDYNGINLNMIPDMWGEVAEAGIYTITGNVEFEKGGIPKDDFGIEYPDKQYQGGIVNSSNSTQILVREVIYINGYETSDGDDGNDITVMRKFAFADLNDVSVEVTIPAEIETPTSTKLKVCVSQELSEFEVLQYNPLTKEYDIYIPMKFISSPTFMYERVNNTYTNTRPTKYKINLKK